MKYGYFTLVACVSVFLPNVCCSASGLQCDEKNLNFFAEQGSSHPSVPSLPKHDQLGNDRCHHIHWQGEIYTAAASCTLLGECRSINCMKKLRKQQRNYT